MMQHGEHERTCSHERRRHAAGPLRRAVAEQKHRDEPVRYADHHEQHPSSHRDVYVDTQSEETMGAEVIPAQVAGQRKSKCHSAGQEETPHRPTPTR